MEFKRRLFLVALIVGCSAVPTPRVDISSIFPDEDILPSPYIVGGSVAQNGSHPHMVALVIGEVLRGYFCAGSLITTRHVLTAAHCINAVYVGGALSSSLRVIVGTNHWNIGGQTYTLARNETHQNYVKSKIKNDIGILITKDEVQLSDLVKIIPLSYDFIGGGVPSRVAGWGRLEVNGTRPPPTLMELVTTTIDGQQCVRDVDAAASLHDVNVRGRPVQPHIELCTFHSTGHGNCKGDSGGALVRIDLGQQIGIVSWGFPCAIGAPDVYTRVSAYKDWILEKSNQTTLSQQLL